MKMPGHPLISIAGILTILALAASTAFVKGLEWTLPLFVIWLALTTVFYLLRVRRSTLPERSIAPK